MYFVSYSHSGKHGHGFRMCEAFIRPSTLDDVLSIARSVEESNKWEEGSVVILNWIPLTGKK